MEADLLLQTLRNLVMALTHLINEKVEVDFDNGETLMRFYSSEDDQWYNKVVKPPPRMYIKPFYEIIHGTKADATRNPYYDSFLCLNHSAFFRELLPRSRRYSRCVQAHLSLGSLTRQYQQ